MKRQLAWICLSLFFLFFSSVYAQSLLKTGNYRSGEENLVLTVENDNQYTIRHSYYPEYLLTGKVQTSEDPSIFELQINSFSVEAIVGKGSANNMILLSFSENSELRRQAGRIFIGLTKKGEKSPTYKSLAEYASFSITVEPSEKIDLVFEKGEGKTEMYTYTLPENISELKIITNISMEAFTLCARQDAETGVIQIWKKGDEVTPVSFEPAGRESQLLLTGSLVEVDAFTYPGKKPIQEFDNEDIMSFSDSQVMAEIQNVSLLVEKSYEAGLKRIKQEKDKYLIAYYYNQQEDSSSFEKDLNKIKNIFYGEADSIRNHFIFCLIKDKEKAILKQYYITSYPCFLILNSKGELMGYQKSEIDSYNPFVESATDFYRFLKGKEASWLAFSVLSNPKSSIEQLQTSLLNLSRLGNVYYNGQDDSDFSQNYYTYSNINWINTFVFDFNKENFVKNCLRLIEAREADKKPDMAYVEFLLNEYTAQKLSNIYPELNLSYRLPSEKTLAYLISHLEEIRKDEIFTSRQSPLDLELYRMFSSQFYEGSGKDIKDALETLEKLSGKINNPFWVLKLSEDMLRKPGNMGYLEEYDTPKYFEKTFQFFSNAFDTYLPSNKDVVVTLDRMFEQNSEWISYEVGSWISYKQWLAELMNSYAWKVVDNSQYRAAFMQKALKWSELSLQIVPDNYYFLDTFAHLLYFTGEKQKAIEYQTKAIKLAQKNRDNSDIEQLQFVLKAMQNNSLE